MANYAYPTSVMDRKGQFLGSYKCSLCDKEFFPIPFRPGEMAVTFGIHVEQSHSSAEEKQGTTVEPIF
jgi:hypothetical protein